MTCFKLIGEIVASAGGQKFFMAMGAGIVNTGLLIAKILPVDAYVTLTLGTVGAFILASAGEQVARVMAQGKDFQRDPYA